MFPFGLQEFWWPHPKIYLILTQCRHKLARFGLMGRASVHLLNRLTICLPASTLAQSDSSLHGYVTDQTGSAFVTATNSFQ